MPERFEVDGNTLTAHLAVPPRLRLSAIGGVVVAHGFPTQPITGRNYCATMPALADRIATETGCAALAYTSRGVDHSEGDFSLTGWRRDLAAAVDLLDERAECDGIWLVGFGTGGSLAVMHASQDPRVRGVASAAASADFDHWARNPRKLLVWSREVGVVHDPQFPASFDRWASELRGVRVTDAAARLGERALLVLHGSEDETTPAADARAIAEAHSATSLRLISGGSHHLRNDPRAIALLLGWLERQQATRWT